MTPNNQNIENMRSRVKDIAFSPPFLHCCPSSLSSPCRVWTPANTEKQVSEAFDADDWGSVDLRGPQWTSEDLNRSQWI